MDDNNSTETSKLPDSLAASILYGAKDQFLLDPLINLTTADVEGKGGKITGYHRHNIKKGIYHQIKLVGKRDSVI